MGVLRLESQPATQLLSESQILTRLSKNDVAIYQLSLSVQRLAERQREEELSKVQKIPEKPPQVEIPKSFSPLLFSTPKLDPSPTFRLPSYSHRFKKIDKEIEGNSKLLATLRHTLRQADRIPKPESRRLLTQIVELLKMVFCRFYKKREI